jgi:hypothetical protein
MSTPEEKTAAAGDTSGRPARPAGYWERIDAIVDAAPPLTDLQRARIRAAIHQPTERREAA